MKINRGVSLSSVAVLELLVFGGLLSAGVTYGEEGGAALRIETAEGGCSIWMGERELAGYRFEAGMSPVFYPVYAPGGQRLTRGYPLEEIEGESRDHPHHRSVWIGHGNINGTDFWHGDARIRHRDLEIELKNSRAVLRTRNDWYSDEGKIVCSDERVHEITAANENYWFLDIDLTLTASNGDITLHDDKEGFLAIRVAPSLRVRGGDGGILNSEGDRDRNAWSKRAAWCSYFGPVEGETVGMTIFDHPANLRHPSWWHVRDYGLFAVNPFGMHTFEGAPEGAGDVEVPSGESLHFRYRIVFHSGTPVEIDAGSLYEDYVNDRR